MEHDKKKFEVEAGSSKSSIAVVDSISERKGSKWKSNLIVEAESENVDDDKGRKDKMSSSYRKKSGKSSMKRKKECVLKDEVYKEGE